MKNIAIVQLGCEKNLLDAEQMLYKISEAGYEVVPHEEDADIIVVNTCCFIEAAEQEAIDTILEMAEYRREGKCTRLIVSGCLAQKHKDEIMKEIPEVDCVVGVGHYTDIVDAIESDICELTDGTYQLSDTPRYVTAEAHTAYIKVADGCDNRCTYCVIPDIRGPYQSRTIESIVAEASSFAEAGAKELILIAQDTTNYGQDLYGKPQLVPLLEKLCAIEAIEWIRLHYLYPERITDELIDFIAQNDKICNYIDMPLQHCNDEILRTMGRGGSKQELQELIDKLRAKIPGVVIRTTFIVGFPGETEEIYDELCHFVGHNKFERMGVFPYSEQDTPSAELPNKVDEEEKHQRADAIMELQHDIMEDMLEQNIGKTYKVLIEGYDSEIKHYHGRSYADTVDVDTKVYFTTTKPQEIGTFAQVEITDYMDLDLFGKQIF